MMKGSVWSGAGSSMLILQAIVNLEIQVVATSRATARERPLVR